MTATGWPDGPLQDDGAGDGMAPPDLPALPAAAVPVLARALERAAVRAFKAANQAGQEARKDRWGLSMSGIGGCRREAAYRLAGVEPTDAALHEAEEARQAMIGTWIHAGLLPQFEKVLAHADIEMPVELTVGVPLPDGGTRRLVVPGTADCYTHVMGGGVLDVKTVNAYRIGAIDHDGIKAAHRWQVRGYATALRQLGYPVAWVAWLYVDRSSGEVLVAIEPFGPDEEAETLAFVQVLWREAQDPDYAVRTEAGPGLSWVCDGCAWLRRCWGPDARPGDSRALQVHDDPEIALAARRYKEVSAEIAKLEKDKERWSAMLGRPTPGTYKDEQGAMIIKYQKDGEAVDKKAAVEQLVLLGGEPPMKKRQGNRLIEWGRKQPEG